MINREQLRLDVIKPALEAINAYSKDAEELLMFTCATESLGGFLLRQIKGPALGIFQMEPATYHDIWRNFIYLKAPLSTMLSKNLNITTIPDEERMIYDLKFAAVMARIHYLRVKGPLPKANDVDGLWSYYKQHYNTPQGKATKQKAMQDYQKYALGKG